MESKNELIAYFKEHDTTVLSFPERGEGGSSKYPGNWSPRIPEFFFWKLDAKSCTEVFAGSGTTSDAAKLWNIPYLGIDLNPNPVRKDIISMDILDYEKELPDSFRCSDVCMVHDPYPGINYIKYAGKAWQDLEDGSLAARDIQNMSYKEGMKALDKAHMRVFSAMPAGSFMVIMMGEIRADGKYYSMYKDMTIPGELYQTYVKLQHNTKSGYMNKSYSKSKRALTGQEMIAVIRKPSGYEIAMVIPKKCVLNISDCEKASWADLVMAFAREEKSFSNEMLYNYLAKTKKAQKGTNNNLNAKARQTCQRLCKNGLLNHDHDGCWNIDLRAAIAA